MFKLNNNSLPANLDSYYKSVKNVHYYYMRSLEIKNLPRFNRKIGYKSLFYQGSKFLAKLLLRLKVISHLGFPG